MEVTRDIVIDLLPLYQSGEESADTRAAVEEFLRSDPSLARLAETDEQITIPKVAEMERDVVNRTRGVVRRRAWILGLALFLTLVPFSFVARDGELTFLMLRDQPGTRVFFIFAVWMWIEYLRLTRKLRSVGL